MNKIKTIKIKNEDGSINEESYTIAVDSINVDMKNGKDLQDTVGDVNVDEDGNIAEQLKKKIDKIYIEDNLNSTRIDKALSANQGRVLNNILNKKPYYFNNVIEMKSNNKLKAGDYVITLGYYNVNDNGGASYLIKNRIQSDVEDNGSIHFIGSDLVAELIVKDYVTPEMFGAKGDGVTNNYEVFYKIISAKYKIVLSKNKNYYLANEILLNASNNVIYIEGNNSKLSHNQNCFKITGTNNLIKMNNIIFEDVNSSQSVGDMDDQHITLDLYNCTGYIQQCIFNKDYDGGVLRVRDGSNNLKIERCTFNRTNKSVGSASSIWAYSTDKNIQNIIFEDCIYNWDGVDEVITSFNGGKISNIVFNNCTINCSEEGTAPHAITVYSRSNYDIDILFKNVNYKGIYSTNIFGISSRANGKVTVDLDNCIFINNKNNGRIVGIVNKNEANNNFQLNTNNCRFKGNEIANLTKIKWNSNNDYFTATSNSSSSVLIHNEQNAENVELEFENAVIFAKCGFLLPNKSDTNKLKITNSTINITGDYFILNGVGGTGSNENGSEIVLDKNIINYTPTEELSQDLPYKNSILVGRNTGKLNIYNNTIKINNQFNKTYIFYYYYTGSYIYNLLTRDNIIISSTEVKTTNSNVSTTNKIDINNYVNFINTELQIKN